ncbi:mitochondrial fission ELM1 family protein [Lysobacter sp. 5GHs7-4]|uniref:mitochondrial fission ELM1 family protein n=1 Tax=Lysobacter sp. 5GHs7-4 TaxID=2904253 RepID=UPI001E2D1542|nr:mitochondrial fission ELM1 family protein [Lysobacter sp. 5GHs7-4]UHQ24059.1 mitochondrial fission ELM1 family protein [Lysobacter sp. 5GHs7-4]
MDETLVLSDGHAGNVRQAQALAAALGRSAREFVLDPQTPWAWTAPRRLPGAARAFGAAFAPLLAAPPALAIGCGRQAALATRLLRERGARAVQILDPRIDCRHWDLVIAPEHDGLHAPNSLSLLGSLHPVDDLWLAAARSAFPAFGALPSPRTALLLGGPSAHAAFDAAGIEALIAGVAAGVEREGGSVLATASRRTPAPVRERLRAHLAQVPGVVWSGPEDGVNPYAGLLGWADRVICSADSVNLLSEAAATTVPLYIAGVDALSGRPRRFVDRLLESGRARRYGGMDALDGYAVTPQRETARIADEVRRRLGLGA